MKLWSVSRCCLEGLVDLVYPRDDFWLGHALEYESGHPLHISPLTLRYLQVIKTPFCDRCGFPIHGAAERVVACQKCVAFEPLIEGNRSVLLMNSAGKKLIHELKYRSGFHLLDDISHIVGHAIHIRDWIEDAILVPVPLHSRKKRERGYNQSLLLAHLFQRVWGKEQTCVAELIKRVLDTETQTFKNQGDRVKNVRSAFAVDPEISVPAELPITLVDDVFTTGATANACALALKQQGFTNIRSVTLGHG